MKEGEPIDRRKILELGLKGGAVAAILAAFGAGGYALQKNPELASQIRKKLPGLDLLLRKDSSVPQESEESGKEMTQERATILVLMRAIADWELGMMTNGEYLNKSAEEREEMLKRWNALYQRVIKLVQSGEKEWLSPDLWD